MRSLSHGFSDLQDSVAPEKALICEKRKEDVFSSAGMISIFILSWDGT